MSNINVIVKEMGKTGGLECLNVYITNVPTYFACVHEPKLKYQSTDKEFSATIFVDEAAKDKLLDEVLLNKSFAQVGVTKTSKPPRRIKYPLSTQVDEGKQNYDAVDGMWGFSVAKPEYSKKNKKMSVNVIDKEGKPFTENIGNGSICTFKLFGYKNQEGQVVVTIDTVQVIEHVPYEGNSAGSGTVVDDVLGVSYSVKPAEEVVEPPKQQEAKKSAPEPEFDDTDLPF